MIKPLAVIFIFTCFLSFAAQGNSVTILQSDTTSLLFKDNHFIVNRNGKKIVDLSSIRFNFEPVNSWQITAQSQDQITLKAELPPSVDFYREVTDQRPREVQLTISKLTKGLRFYAAPEWGLQVTLDFDYLGDHFFGLSAPLQPDNQLSPDLTGTTTQVDIYSEGAAYRENYASAFSALYISTHGYGGFYDSFARGRYEFAINGRNRIHHDTGILDWYILTGDDGPTIHKAYFELIGSPKKVPAWALGPVGWRDQNNGGAKEIIDDIDRLSSLKIPFTSWFVDRPYSDGNHAWSKMNFSSAFANPEKWIAKIRKDYGLEFMTWVATATFGDARFAKHLAGKFSYIDLSDSPSVTAYQSDLQQLQYTAGVRGHKIDRADEGFPISEDWQDGTEIAQRRNKYAFLMAKIHDDALRAAWGDNQVTFARTAIHRSQPYLSAIWGGDPRTSWEGLQSNYANAVRSGFMGFPVWGTDVGGYQGDGYIPEDLYLRWLQAGSMSGLFEIKLDGAGGSGKDRMPWQYSEEFQTQFRTILNERMRLLPYLYSLANSSATTGVMMQPMAYRHLTDSNTYAIWDQFYLGEALLVAPVLDEKLSRKVYLPAGNWRSYNNPGEPIRGGKYLDIAADLNTLPRYIKENSIFVSGNIFRGNDRLWDNSSASLQLHAYPAHQNGSVKFVYVDMLDDDKAKHLSLTRSGKQIQLTGPALATVAEARIFLQTAPKKVLLDGTEANFEYDISQQTLSMQLSQNKRFTITILL